MTTSAWPSGDGEMAQRIREFDWELTPLGPISDWPQSLKTIVDLMLASHSMRSLVWGPAAIHFHNDSFTELLREDRSLALGRSAYETFARSREVFEADVAAGMAGRSARLTGQRYPVLRQGYLSDAWFDVEYAPVRDEAGAVAGVLWTLNETTAHHLAEQVLRASEASRRVALESGRMGPWQWDCRARVVGTSPLLLSLWGLPPADGPVPISAFTARMTPEGAASIEAVMARAGDMAPGAEIDGDVEVASGPTAGRWVRWRGRADLAKPWVLHGVSFDVTEARLAEAALRESEGRLREREAVLARVQRIGEVGGLDIDVEGGMTSRRSPEYLQVHGLPIGEHLETHADWRARIHPDDVEQAEQSLFAALEGAARSYESEYRIIRPSDGAVRWIAARADIERHATGKARRVIGAHIDITEQKHVQEALRASEARLRSFAENSADVLWIANRTGTQLEYLSPAFERMFGAARDAIMADPRRVRDLVHPADRTRFDTAMPRALSGETVIIHYRVVRPSGDVIYLRDTRFPIHDAPDRELVSPAICQIAGVVQDISDINAAQAALEAEKERFRTLAEGIPQLVWRSGDDGLWSWSSPQWQAFTGQTQANSHGWDWLDAVHPDDREATRQAWHEARVHGQLDVEFRVRRASDGVWRWHQTRSVPVRNGPTLEQPDGRIVEWLGTTTDIEDLKHLQGQQAVMVAELQHRTRNLLAVVRSIARRSIAPSPGRDEYDARLAALGRVQGFLSRSAVYAVKLADLVAAELEAAGDGVSDKVEVGGPAVHLPGESVQAVALALHELATNAVKYGAIAQHSGRLSVTWRVETGSEGRQLVIDWRESGVTMPEGPPARRGYGSELITQALPYQLQAETALEFTSDGVRCRVVLPHSAFSSPEMEGVG